MANPSDFLGFFFALGLLGLLFLFVFAALAITFVVFAVLTVVQAYQAKRTGWWIYLICMFISPLSLAAIIAWFVYFKKNPTKLGGDITI